MNLKCGMLALGLVMIGLAGEGQAQVQMKFEASRFEAQVLIYEPVQRAGVEVDEFRKGVRILEETKTATKGNPANFNEADYWNICIAFMALDEPKEHLRLAFHKGTDADPSTFCGYIEAFGHSPFAASLPEENARLLARCGTVAAPASHTQEAPAASPLVRLMAQIQADDSRYRATKPVDWSKQRPLDLANQALIDSLFEVHGGYVGKDMVGDELATAMWAVIQHSDTLRMHRYLPAMRDAARQGELEAGAYKMLLDRYLGLTQGFQLYGTQMGFGFRMATPEEKAAVEAVMGL